MNNLSNMDLGNDILNYKEDFVNKYGNYYKKFTELDILGHIKTYGIYILVFIFAIVLMIICFGLSISLKPTTRKILYYIGWFFTIVAIIILGYGIYLYYFVYLKHRNEWFKDLPSFGQKEVDLLKKISNTGESLKGQIGESLKSQIGESLKGQIGESLKSQIGESLKGQMGQSIKSQIGESLKGQMGQSIKSQIGESLKGQMGQSIKSQIGESLKGQMGQSIKSQIGESLKGQMGQSIKS